MIERRDGLWGRRKGKPLSARRTDLMSARFPALALDIEAPAPADLATLFGAPVSAVRLEIGFGGGEHLIHQAKENPEIGFIGVEPFLNGLANAVASITELGLSNVRLFGKDASVLLDWLPSESLQQIDLLYPDPWPKKRHWKRRFISPNNLDRISRTLIDDGQLRIASDIEAYIAWSLFHCLRRDDFEWMAQRADDWRKPFPNWPGTRYEAKAIAAARKPTYLIFRKRRNGATAGSEQRR